MHLFQKVAEYEAEPHLMRKLQLSPKCLKTAKLCFDVLEGVGTFTRVKVPRSFTLFTIKMVNKVNTLIQGVFTLSEQSPGRSLFEAQICEALPRAPLKGLFEKSPLRNLKNFVL